jgi:hypothetical protein
LFFGSENLRTPIYEKGFRFALQKRCHRFACFGQEKKDGTSKALAEFCMLWARKKTISKALIRIPMNWEALQKRWGLFV